MDEWSISVEEVMRITKKSRDFIINAIQQGVFPGSVVIHSSGKRSTYIPRKAFWQKHIVEDIEPNFL